jgi:hypothetical protein
MYTTLSNCSVLDRKLGLNLFSKNKVNFSKLENHVIEAELYDVQEFDSLSVHLYNEDNELLSKEVFKNLSKKDNYFYLQTNSFNFIPSEGIIEIKGYDKFAQSIIHRENFEHEIIKSVIIDRNGRSEKMYLIEGDEFNLFGDLKEVVPVSTGKINNWRCTPLGFYHVRSKDRQAVNTHKGWLMKYALWYFDKSQNQPANGIHQGYKGKQVYGLPSSHGCTRVPEDTMIDLFYWSSSSEENEKNPTLVMIIDSEESHELDKKYFDVSDYYLFKDIILKNLKEKKDITPLKNIEKRKLKHINKDFKEIINSCHNWEKPNFEKGYEKRFFDFYNN